jgi:prolyl oligopeptidase
MKRSRSRILFVIVALCFTAVVVSAQTQPIAPVRNAIDKYYGTRVTDPYRYMENLKDPMVRQWMEAQDEYTRSILKKIPGRDELYKRMVELQASVVADVSFVYRLENGRIFYLKKLGNEELFKLCMRDGLHGQENVLVDPEVITEQTRNIHALSYFMPSGDGKYVAYGISQSGTEKAVLHVMDTETKEDIEKPIDRSDFGITSWLPDDKGFLYNRLQEITPDMPVSAYYLKNRVYWHRLGADPDNDIAVFGYGAAPELNIDEVAESYVYVWPGSSYLYGVIFNGDQNEIRIYAAPLDSLGASSIHWKSICEMVDEVTDFTVHGDDIYLLTHKNAPRFKLIRTSVINPALEKAVTIVPEGEAVLEDIKAARDGLYVRVLADGVDRYLRFPYDGTSKPEYIPLPYAGTIYPGRTDPRIDGIIFGTASWTDYGGIYMYDPRENKTVDTGLQPRGPYDAPEDLVAEEVKVRSHDGVLVPLSIVHKKNLVLNGSNPTILEGYGAYGISSKPFYDQEMYAWYELGGIYAVAHVRGGGEYGEEWHKAGQKATKANTWKDLIAGAEYLIQKKYTSPQKLAAMGGSAGGITAGRAITERPDLFGAAILRVGALNTLRSETSANGPPNIPEFGTVTTEEGFKALYEMDSYQHVVDGVRYPAVMLTHGFNDPRVDVWESAKMAARLQRATASKKPVLLRIDFEAGHGYGSTTSQYTMEWADICAFLLWQFGVPAFQPRP